MSTCNYIKFRDGKNIRCGNKISSFTIEKDDDENPLRKYASWCPECSAKMQEICTTCNKSRKMHDEWNDESWDGHDFVAMSAEEKRKIIGIILKIKQEPI